MKKAIFNLFACSACAVSLALSGLTSLAVAAADSSPSTMDALKQISLQALSKQDSQAEEIVKKATAYAESYKQGHPNTPLSNRLGGVLQQIVYGSAGFRAAQLGAELDLLKAVGNPHKEPTAEELAPLQERYKKLCAKMDSLALSKDLDEAFQAHDIFIKYSSLGLWDKEKISSELELMEALVEKAPDISADKIKFYQDNKNKHLVTVPKHAYVGTTPEEQVFLSTDRRSNWRTQTPCIELIEHLIQGPDGQPVNFDDCNLPALGCPFSPPITLWAKSRIRQGCVPAILLNFVDIDITSSNPVYFNTTANYSSIADVVEGKLDQYMQYNMKLIGADKAPMLVGLCSDFDREVVSNAFGADGRTPYQWILDPKLKDMPESKRAEEIKKHQLEGLYVKSNPPQLSDQYGDKKVPDGPERVRDAWKRTKQIMAEHGGSTLGFFNCSGNFHGNKNACSYPGELKAGNQPWNKLEYYWPGKSVFDWAGINAMGDDPKQDPKGPNIMEALKPYITELGASSWKSTPVMLIELAPGRSRKIFEEAAWVKTVFTTVIPQTFPNILSVFVFLPGPVTLWTPDAQAAYQSDVKNNNAYSATCKFAP